MKIYSFDIFDTLIARSVAQDGRINELLAVKVQQHFGNELANNIAQNFEAIRNEANARAHDFVDHPEIRLDEIYLAISKFYPEIDKGLLKRIQEFEENLEVDLCYGISENIERILELLDNNKRVVLISDTHHSGDTIRRMLRKVESRLSTLTLYASSEIRLRKLDASLFKYVAEKEGVVMESIEHFGDNSVSDNLIPKKLGAQTTHFTASHRNSIEAAYLNEMTGITGSVIASASQRVRLEKADGERTLFNTVGASFTGPFFYGFIEWCLVRISALGIKDVFFLARDGYILIEIAKHLQPRLAPDTKLHYLYISRQATLLSSLTKVTNQSLDWVFEEMDNVITLARVASRLQCSCEDLEVFLPEQRRPDHERRLSNDQIQLLREAIVNCESFRKKIEATAEKARLALVGYLDHSGISHDSHIALVDIGWKSTIQDCIYRALSTQQQNPHIEGFYYGCSHYSNLTSGKNRKHPYQISPSNHPGLGPILELLLMAPHGTTIRYVKNDAGEYSPDIKAFNQPQGNWNIQAYFDGITSFIENISIIQNAHPELEINPHAVNRMLLELLEDPPYIIAECLGDLPYCGDQEESNPRVMAPPFSAIDACKYLFTGTRSRSEKTQWLVASKNRSGPIARCILALDPQRHLVNLVRSLVSSETLRNKLCTIKKRLRA